MDPKSLKELLNTPDAPALNFGGVSSPSASKRDRRNAPSPFDALARDTPGENGGGGTGGSSSSAAASRSPALVATLANRHQYSREEMLAVFHPKVAFPNGLVAPPPAIWSADVSPPAFMKFLDLPTSAEDFHPPPRGPPTTPGSSVKGASGSRSAGPFQDRFERRGGAGAGAPGGGGRRR